LGRVVPRAPKPWTAVGPRAQRRMQHVISERAQSGVGGAPRRPQRRPRRGGNPRLKSRFPRGVLGEICRGGARSRRRARVKKTAPNVRCGEAVRTHQSSPGSIHRGRSGGPPAELAHDHSANPNPRFFTIGQSRPFKRVTSWNFLAQTLGR
jgi:hypothetical protein